ncbi:hypothetical protein Acsp03_05680 [Actinomadura sp. NBRC 104412]|uniref:hypothetical protein n=1 Tax=Actinomadura sp. NBRC 104412 TaxID=3032203 RepID=UPI0024A035A4|nr:hypothetical protein [Actinomadura sp. NBRC 104412]GLZ03101.1 hypothetical protein Acsp03_05680 [Actinomadura sp. NBRC 104412]
MPPPSDQRARAGRRGAEIALPGFLIGLAGGVLIGLLAVLGDLPAAHAAVVVLVLGLPLAVAGACYDLLLLRGRMGIGTFAPAVAFWLPLFPLARLLDEALSDVLAGRPVALPDAVLPFLLFQAIISVSYAIGFVLLHEQVAPRWWLRVRDRNPDAALLIERYKRHAALQIESERRRGRSRL